MKYVDKVGIFMLRIGLCDEEINSIQTNKELLEKILTEKKIEYVIYEFMNRKELFMYLQKEIYDLDLLFLEVIIGQDNGIDIAKDMVKMYCRTSIVFLTKYMQYCSKVYEVEHSFFVLKKDLEVYMPIILEKELHHKDNLKRERIVVPVKGHKIILMPIDILYLERDKRSTQAVCISETVTTSSDLLKLQQQLNGGNFVRCHNSYIVNLVYVKEFCRNEMILSNGKNIPISRKYLNDVRRAFARWLGEAL